MFLKSLLPETILKTYDLAVDIVDEIEPGETVLNSAILMIRSHPLQSGYEHRHHLESFDK